MLLQSDADSSEWSTRLFGQRFPLAAGCLPRGLGALATSVLRLILVDTSIAYVPEKHGVTGAAYRVTGDASSEGTHLVKPIERNNTL